ncbi:MAG: ThiF family adenylyltransferase [Planctomycetes bacterium]|nr:ThiF family adenylyltransferase [Planctomycetota bacterium]
MSQLPLVNASESHHGLVLSHGPWEQALRAILMDPGLIAAGSIRAVSVSGGTEWLVDRLDVVTDLPQGSQRWPLTNWIILSMERSGQTAMQVIQQARPRQSQTVVAVVLNGHERGKWEGVVHQQGHCFPLQSLRVVGPGMLALDHQTGFPAEPIPEQGRWSRTAGALGASLWRQVRSSHVLLVGCGRNGTLAAWQLAGLGVSHLTLVDPDQLELANLDAMPGMALDDVGQFKVLALARHLVEFNPDLLVHCQPEPVTEILARLRGRFQLVISCVDQEAARLAVSWLSRELLIPHLDIGTSITRDDRGQTELSGDVRLLLPSDGCVECVGGIAVREQSLYEFAAPRGSLHRGEPIAWHQQRAGSLGHLNGVAVGAGLELWLSLLRGTTSSFWQRIAWSTATCRVDGATVQAAEDCPHCRPVRETA